jgi:hypothetical protein
MIAPPYVVTEKKFAQIQNNNPAFSRRHEASTHHTKGVQDNQQMLKGVVRFYYTHQITPTCFVSSLPSSGGYTFLVSYSSIVCASGGRELPKYVRVI